MATQKQIESNRRNSQFSTGPRTVEGKAVSRMNALKSGIDATYETTCGEYPSDLAELAAEYDRQFQPMGPVERVLVDLIIKNDWLLRRYRFLRADLTGHSANGPFSRKQGHEYGAGFATNTEAIHRLHRHDVDAERAYFRNLDELERRQNIRRKLEAELQPDTPSVTDSAETENPEIGFVPQTDLEPVAPIPPPPQAPAQTPAAPAVSPIADRNAKAPSLPTPAAPDSSQPELCRPVNPGRPNASGKMSSASPKQKT
jgi:hypothetical protein